MNEQYPEVEKALQDFLPESPDNKVLQSGRNLTVRATVGGIDAAIKCFPAPTILRSLVDKIRSLPPKTVRAFEAAAYLHERCPGATPEPIGLVMRRRVMRKSYGLFATRFEPGLESLTSRLARLYKAHGPGHEIIDLLERVAKACRAMHDAGFFHGDLGNQNIALAPDGRVMFVDLNRARLMNTALPIQRRARDLSRIALPSDFLRVFFDMYWGQVPPEKFISEERRYRRQFAFHSKTRRLRHPFRPRKPSTEPVYPHPKDLWIFDECSEQALVTLRRKDRRRYQSISRVFAPIWALLKRPVSLVHRYHRYKRSSFARPILSFSRRVFVSVCGNPIRFKQELAALKALPGIGTHVRFYAHEDEAQIRARVNAVRTLYDQGRAVAISLVQSRDSVNNPEGWVDFCARVLSTVGRDVCWVEYLHAVNRVKWGFWNFAELKVLLDKLPELRSRFPDVAFIAPSVIDFEWDYFAAACRLVPPSASLQGASAELYVDRRGAPESIQGRFDALGKLCLLKAILGNTPAVGSALYVTEFNWPLLGTGVWSPVGAPYVSPGERHNDPSVDEDSAAAYTIRYLLLGICSGLAENMVFWSMSGHGFGLLDPGTSREVPEGAVFRERPAYKAFAHFAQFFKPASFTDASCKGEGGLWVLRFLREDGHRCAVAWRSSGEAAPVPSDKLCLKAGYTATDMLGAAIDSYAVVGAAPVYFIEVW